MAAPKRSPDQIKSDRTRVSELLLVGYTHEEIAEILASETGIELSRRQITYDVNKVREDWLTRRVDNYDAIVNEELARVDAYERIVWNELRESKSDKVRKVVEQLRRKSKKDDDPADEEMFVARITETIEKTNTADVQLLRLILDCHQERRRIRGAYAPVRSDVDIHKTTVVVKGYATVSPDDWDDPIEGEFEEKQALEAEN